MPIFVLMLFSFNSSKSRGHWGGFTLNWYAQLFKDREMLQALSYTLEVAIISAIAATIIGTFAAIAIFELRKWKKTAVMAITNIPVLNPDIVTGVSLMVLFTFAIQLTGGGQLGAHTMIFAHITFNIPFVILSVLPKLSQLDPDLFKAAQDLGASPLRAYKRVILPEIFPGVITGAILAFTMSIDDFVISFFTTGSGVTNLSIYIYSMAKRGISPKINALSTLMFIVIMLLLFGINKRDQAERKVKNEH